MRLGLALHYIRGKQITGIERYGLSVATAVMGADRNMQLHVLASRSIRARHSALGDARIFALPTESRIFAEQCVLPVWSTFAELDLLHVPAFGGSLVHCVPFVLTIHDAVFWDMPWALSTLGKYYYRPVVHRALSSRLLRATIYPTRASLEAVVRHFPELKKRAFVCSNAVEVERSVAPRRWTERSDGPIRVLTVGTIEPRKNLGTAAAALSALSSMLGRPILWQLVGRKGWAGEIEERVLRDPIVRWLGTVGDEQLTPLYRSADLYLSLSHLEGFNYPIAEAMSQGTPAVLSDLPVHREVGGDGALYAPADRPDVAARAMYELLTNADAWDTHASAAWHYSARFTPDAFGSELLNVYHQAHASSA